MRELNERLSMGAADVSRTVRITPAGAVRARGDRRRTRLAAMLAAAVGAITAVGAGAVVTGGGLLTSPGTGPPPPRTQIPADFIMPHEGEPGWQSDDSPDAAAAFAGCAPSDPTLPGRTDARTIAGLVKPHERTNPPERYVAQVLLYETEEAAQSAIAGLAASVRACRGWTAEESESDWNDPPFQGRRYTEGQWSDNEWLEGRRLGNGIFLIYARPRGMPTLLGINDRIWLGAEFCSALRLCPPGTPPPPTGTGPRPTYPWWPPGSLPGGK